MENIFTTLMKLSNSDKNHRRIDLSIIIPSYQEAMIIGKSLTTLAKWLDSHDYGTVEVVVVVADSPDGTRDIVKQHMPLFEHIIFVEPGERVGKGRDVRDGMLAANGRYRVFMDADLATPLNHLNDLKKFIKDDADIAIAVRDLKMTHPDLLRRSISGFGNLLAQIILLPGIPDTQCGFKLFRADIAVNIFERLTILGWGFDLEVLALARHYNYSIKTFKIKDWSDPKAKLEGLSNDSPLSAAFQTLKDLIKIRINIWMRRYSKLV